MAANNFKPFGIGSGANVTAQADYEALAALISGFQSGKASSAQINKALRQGTVMASVLAQFIANASGADVLDNGDTATLLTNFLAGLKANTAGGFLQTPNNLSEIKTAGATSVAAAVANLGLGTGLTGVIGDARNAKMSVTAASATATFTADELIVGVALGGLQYRLGSFSKTINLATTGAGGMDTGAAPASGYVALYAIYNPTTAASALLAVNATAAIAPTVYGGSNMPSGYTASALVSVWSTNASSQLSIGVQTGRHVDINIIQVFSSSAAIPTTPTALSVSSAAPPNASKVGLLLQMTATATGQSLQMALTGNAAITSSFGAVSVAYGSGYSINASGTINISTTQTIYYYSTSTLAVSRVLYVGSYDF